MIHAREALVSVAPVIVEREVLWGECDPAGFVYTPRFGDYAASAAGYFSGQVLPQARQPETGEPLGFPMKAISFVFRSFLRPDDRFSMRVSVSDIGNTTFGLFIEATKGDAAVFDCEMRRICFNSKSGRAVSLPPKVRTTLTAYRSQHTGS